MLLGARQYMSGGKRLPYDAEVEYIESTGTQWIDTGVVATSNTHINVRFSDYTVAGAWLFGARIAFRNSALGVFVEKNVAINSWCRARGTFTSGYFTYTTAGVGVVTFDYDKANFTATRELVPTTVTGTDATGVFSSSPYSIYLWTLNNGGRVTNIAHAKMYGVKIWEDDVLICDFIPVRIGTDGAMYDRANPNIGMNRDGTPRTDGLYLNRGTGNFVLPTA